jgi:hypothetical protein
LERKAAGRLEWFELRDGRLYFYDPTKVAMQLAAFALDVLMSEGDEAVAEPPILRRIRQAKDREGVVRKIEGGGTDPSKDFVMLGTLVGGSERAEGGL